MSGPLHRPYPPDVYRGTTGEVSARLRPDGTEAEIRFRSGGTCEYLATGDRTGTTFGLYRWTFGEKETGPEPHFHRAITESFYVLSGEVQLYDGAGWKVGHSGGALVYEYGATAAYAPAGDARVSLEQEVDDD